MLSYESIGELVAAAEAEGKKLSDLILKDQAEAMEKSEDDLYLQMEGMYCTMRESAEHGADSNEKSVSGLSGGAALKIGRALESGNILGGRVVGLVLQRALAVAEVNACMGKIVAAPTAGSCGILPAVIMTIQQERGIPERQAVMSLFTASGFGMVIAKKASISGAEGGCQAECGSASAMAAAALVEMAGGTPQMSAHACALALKSVMGLVCDPVAGLVEVPCVKRNATGALNALASADMALAGVESAIPADEVCDAMNAVGDAMPASLKETASGGIADTPTARKIEKSMFQWRETSKK